ncbi:MAG: integrin alpha [Thermoplasmatota archaeon]
MNFDPIRHIAVILTLIIMSLSFSYEPADAVLLDEDISLSNADGSFIGEYAGAGLGTLIAFAGDVNGDGYDDILMSSDGYDTAPSGGTDVGKVYLIFGNASSNIKDMDVANANATFLGEGQWNYAGRALDGAGDLNGDGFDDIIISAARGPGKTYVIFGRRTGWSMNMNLVHSNASFIGEGTSDQSYRGLSGVGDVNNDGYDDFVIGATWNSAGGNVAGQAYLILGRSSGWSNNVSLANVNASFIGEEAGDLAGNCVSGGGDINGDGYDDIIIGAYQNDEGGGNAGKVYIIYGRSSGWSMDVDLSSANASFIGPTNTGQGKAMSMAGDINGDGYDDILISSDQDSGGGLGLGRAYLAFGGSNLGHNVSLYNANASFVGQMFDHLGSFIAGAGDLNGDGYDDFMVAATDNNGGGSSRGKVHVIYGKSSGWTMNASATNSDGASFVGEADYDKIGSVAGEGDVNNDRRLDILIGTTINDEGGTNAGQVYLILNEPNSPPTITTIDDTSASEDEE